MYKERTVINLKRREVSIIMLLATVKEVILSVALLGRVIDELMGKELIL